VIVNASEYVPDTCKSRTESGPTKANSVMMNNKADMVNSQIQLDFKITITITTRRI